MTDDDLGKLWNVARYQGSWDAFVQTARALESRVLAERKEPVAWVRYRSDGGFEGPIMDSDARMCDTRRSFWTPLFAHPTPDDANLLPHIRRDIRIELARAEAELNVAGIQAFRRVLAAIDRARQSGEEGNE
jgi:hypothetical protein